MSIRIKLLLGFFVVVLMSGLASTGAIYSVSTLGQLAIDMYDKPLMAISFARSAQSDFQDARQALLPVLNNPEAVLSEEQFDDLEFDYETFVEDLEVVAERTSTDRSRALTDVTTVLAEKWWAQAKAILDKTSGDAPAAVAAMTELSDAIEEKLETLVDYESENGYYFRQDAESAIELAWWTNIGAAVAILILGVLIAFLLGTRFSSAIRGMTAAMTKLASGDTSVEIPSVGRRDEMGEMASALQVFKDNAIDKARGETQAEEARAQFEADREAQENIIETSVGEVVSAAIAGELSARIDTSNLSGVLERVSQGVNTLLENVDRGLSETASLMSALANGDLTQRMTGDYQGRFLQLKQDANSMAEQIEAIAGRISSVTGAVRRATREIATGVSDLSARTEHQASSLEETTASMEELSTTVRQNAENAQEANQVSMAAQDTAVSGGEIAEKAITAMSGIEQSSRQITDIVGLIQEIAFQTNLLALNASVEAARAGDAGKGFAVVANEVRALAQRAATASKDIKALIVNSDNQVKAGVELVNQAGASLGEIVTSVKKVADFVSEIAAASQEQSAGIEQVSNAVTNMDEMTQQNASLVEETNAALQSAQSQVEDLRQAVAFFKTGDEELEPDSASPAPPAEQNPAHQQEEPTQLAMAAAGGAAA